MAKTIKFGDPVGLAIVVSSIDEVFINEDDNRKMVIWLRGGQVQSVKFDSAEECRHHFGEIIQALDNNK